jgi:uncharacterized protein YcaQ
VKPHQLTQPEARQIAIRAQLLDRRRPAGLIEMIRQLTLVQADQTATVAPNADLVSWSRLGPSYAPADLSKALDDRTLIELQGMIRPAEDVALYRAEMAQWRDSAASDGWQLTSQRWVRANDACRGDLLIRLAAAGPMAARELPDTCEVAWGSTGWTNNKNVIQMLGFMVRRGEAAVAGREGRERLYDLASRVYPDGPTVPLEEAMRTRGERRLRSLGIARPRGPESSIEPGNLAEVGDPAVVEGLRGKWRVDPAQLDQPFEGRTALLSPLDRLVFDRKRILDLFDFDYQLEMYKPVEKRRWGYFALPILHGDYLVGKLDATADRKEGILRVDAIHEDIPFDGETTMAVDAEIESLAQWLDLEPSLPSDRRAAKRSR